ncbi:MAG: extensin family protein [Deltaproteobacteria bacterium]|nr:extensin family protein [Deltaproteobacteria bacterium]
MGEVRKPNWLLLFGAITAGAGFGLYQAARVAHPGWGENDAGPRVEDAGPAPVDAGAPPDAGLEVIDQAFNPGFIGAACDEDADCQDYEGAFCLGAEHGFPRGTCSRSCDRLCPDQRGDHYAPTFCVESPVEGHAAVCLAQCNLHLTDSGCRPGYVCTSLRRAGEQKARLVCLPDHGHPAAPTACTARLDDLGLTYARPDLADTDARGATPDDPVPDESLCIIDTPVLLSSPLHGVDFRAKGQRFADHLLVACDLAPALEALAKLLARHGIVEVEHNGTYVCRGVAGTRSLSGHGRGLAIDITAFERAVGTPVSVEADWEGKDREKKRALRALVRELKAEKLFDKVLTPASNEAHRDHLHLELRYRPGPELVEER